MAMKPLIAEIAPRKASAWEATLARMDFPNHILLSESCNQCGGDLYALFNEMEEKDGHLFSVLQTRKNGVLARERNVISATDSDADRRIAEFVEDALESIPNFGQVLMNVLDAISKGFSIQEILWTIRADHKVGIESIKHRYSGRFVFDSDGRPRLASMPGLARFQSSLAGSLAGRSNLIGPPLPERKFILFAFGAQNGNPYGKGLLARAFWYYWFKK